MTQRDHRSLTLFCASLAAAFGGLVWVVVSRRQLWGATLGMVLLAVSLCALTGLKIVIPPFYMLAWAIALAASATMRFPPVCWQSRTLSIIETTLQLSLIAATGAMITYGLAEMARAQPYADGALAAADRALGFDWRLVYSDMVARPWLSAITRLAYRSIFLSPFLLLVILCCADRADRAGRFVLAYAIALLATLALFPFFPAREPLAYYFGGYAPYLPVGGDQHFALMEALRGKAPPGFDLGAPAGIITFPSFHAESAILFVWAAWPVAALR